MNRTILIWDYNLELKNSGGPAGYLYNIYCEINQKRNNNIIFLSQLLQKDKNIIKINNYRKHSLREHKLYKKISSILNWYRKEKPKELISINFNEFDIIHFHSSLSLSIYSNVLKNYKGIIVLTSHSPQPLSHELIDDSFSNKYFKTILYHTTGLRELNSWKKADYLMFPVKEAIEVYFENPRLKDYYLSNKSKFIFCESSIRKLPNKDSTIDIRKRLGLRDNTRIISFIGRHNEIKGYDQLKQIARILLNTHTDIYFVVAGKEYPLKRLDDDKWIELGWIDYGRYLIDQSDLFILPNKATYFDLVALEVLQEGTPILMTNTGGNKYFQQLDTNDRQGIIIYDYPNLTEAVEKIKKYLRLSKEEVSRMRESNKTLFNRHFTTTSFLKRYINLMNNL